MLYSVCPFVHFIKSIDKKLLIVYNIFKSRKGDIMEDYSKTVNRVRELLKLNTEWQSRFDGYINLLNSESLDKMKKARSS